MEKPCSLAQLSLEGHIALFDYLANGEMLAPLSTQLLKFELIKLLVDLLLPNVLYDDLLLESY